MDIPLYLYYRFGFEDQNIDDGFFIDGVDLIVNFGNEEIIRKSRVNYGDERSFKQDSVFKILGRKQGEREM